MTKKEYHLEIESDPNNLITVEEFVNYFATEAKLDGEKMSNLLLCITEAITNAIIHAHKKDKSKIVKIDVTTDDEEIIIVVKDQGKGFDPSKIPDPTHPDNLLKDSGRGLYLMRIFLKELRYNITPTGTETIMVMKK